VILKALHYARGSRAGSVDTQESDRRRGIESKSQLSSGARSLAERRTAGIEGGGSDGIKAEMFPRKSKRSCKCLGYW